MSSTTNIWQLGETAPQLPESGAFWIAPSANVIGNVILEEEVSIWGGTVMRGDNERITIGAGSNLQENVVCHTDPGFPLTLGANCTVGHKAMLHGCTIGEGSLVGMGATILNGARIGRNCLIGAGALVTEGAEIPDGHMVLGMPAKVKRPLSDAEIAGIAKTAEGYRQRAHQFRQDLRPLPPV